MKGAGTLVSTQGRSGSGDTARRPTRAANRRPSPRMSPPSPTARRLISLGSLLAVLLLWELSYRQAWFNPLFTSSPTRIVSALIETIETGELQRHGVASTRLFAISFGLSVATALPLGVVIGWYPRIRAASDPFISILYATPRIALIPLVIVWFGIGFTAQVVIVWLAAVFPLLINTVAGVDSIDARLLGVAKSFLARDRDIFRTLALPTAVPYIIAGLRLSLIQALLGVVVAEFFVGNLGIGSLIVSAGLTLRTDKVFVGVLVMAVVALTLTALFRRLEARLARWKQAAG